MSPSLHPMGSDPDGSAPSNPASDAGTSGPTVPCPAGLDCTPSCATGGVTSISGKVYDPALKNGLYNVSVYVLPRGVPTGAAACSCAALFPSGVLASTTTAEDGSFTLSGAPAGASVPLVIQVGKWRRLYHVNVNACQANAQADKTLAFPSTVAASNTDDNIPDIAVSTGSSDTLECLMRRVGIAASEYVAGPSLTGNVHIFAGGDPSGGFLASASAPAAPSSRRSPARQRARRACG
jgi:hypothetical protein